jgi:hypothetical protein
LHHLLDKGPMIPTRRGAVKTDAINLECVDHDGLSPECLFNPFPRVLRAQIPEGDPSPIIVAIIPTDGLSDQAGQQMATFPNPVLDVTFAMIPF